MRVIKIAKLGSPDGLVLGQVPDLLPGEGEVVIEVSAAGVGLVDVLKRRDGLGGAGPGHILGGEVAGTIIRVGVGVDQSLIGRRVFAQGSGGGYAEQFVVSASRAFPIPEGLSFDDTIALGMNALVAHFSLEMSRLQDQERVLVRGASGGIGFHAVQLAHLKGGHVTAITSKPDLARFQRIGAEEVLSREEGEATSGEFDVIIDPVAGGAITTFIGKLARRGRYILLGVAAGFPPRDFEMSLIANFSKSPTFSVFSMASITDEELAAACSAIFATAMAGKLEFPAHTCYRLQDAVDAHVRFEQGLHFEKIILRADD